jgi:lysophospholipid acyltransferase (LPLAT)-like uncharacterized protein
VAKPSRSQFEFDPLTGYTWKQRLLIRAAGLIGYFLTLMLGKLTRFEVEGMEHLEAIEAAGKQPVLVFWHDRILLATYYFRDRRIIVLSSKSFDAEYTARIIKRFGFGTIKGSSTRGGRAAMVEMIRTIRKEGYPAGFTLDGPRGPRYQVKSGPLLVAKKTGNPIVPFVVEARQYWTLASWDRLQIPRPLTRAKVIVGMPVYIDPEANGPEMERKLVEMQSSLDELVERGTRWRTGVP